MKKNVFALAAFVALLGTVASCNKNNSTPTPPGNTAPQPTAPTDADGAFVLINTITYNTVGGTLGIPSIINKIEVGAATAWLGAPGAFVDAGAVKCQDSLLTKTANNAYVFQPKSLNGIEKSTSTKWEVEGSGSVAGFNYTHIAAFPLVDSIANGSDVNTNAAFTLESKGNISNSDSVIFVISGPSGSVLKVKGPNVKTCDFSAAELSSVGKGDNSGLLQIAPYRFISSVHNGKKYYFIKETCVSKIVNLK